MEDNKKMPNGIYFRLLTEIAPRIHAVLLERDCILIDRGYGTDGDYTLNGLGDPEKIAAAAVYHAKALINEMYENRFND